AGAGQFHLQEFFLLFFVRSGKLDPDGADADRRVTGDKHVFVDDNLLPLQPKKLIVLIGWFQIDFALPAVDGKHEGLLHQRFIRQDSGHRLPQDLGGGHSFPRFGLHGEVSLEKLERPLRRPGLPFIQNNPNLTQRGPAFLHFLVLEDLKSASLDSLHEIDDSEQPVVGIHAVQRSQSPSPALLPLSTSILPDGRRQDDKPRRFFAGFERRRAIKRFRAERIKKAPFRRAGAGTGACRKDGRPPLAKGGTPLTKGRHAFRGSHPTASRRIPIAPPPPCQLRVARSAAPGPAGSALGWPSSESPGFSPSPASSRRPVPHRRGKSREANLRRSGHPVSLAAPEARKARPWREIPDRSS